MPKNIKLPESEKYLREAKKCSNCGACTAGCPLYAYSGTMPGDLLFRIAEKGEISPFVPYFCTLCGYCSFICPQGVKLDQVMKELRLQAATEEGKLPEGINYRPVRSHQKYSFSPLFNASYIPGNYTGIIFFPGCSLPAFRPDLTRKTYIYLKEKVKGTGIMLNCCARPTLDMGDKKTFDKYYKHLRQELEKYRVKKIITACPGCYHTLKVNSPDIEVASIWEILALAGIPETLRKEKIKPDFTTALHDPCPTRSYPAVHDSVRHILKELAVDFAEFKFNRQKTLCCGAGGMLNITNPQAALSWMQKRAAQTEAETIVTYCQECVVSLQKGGKKSLHLLDLVFNPDTLANKINRNPGLLARWYNRYKTKKILKREVKKS